MIRELMFIIPIVLILTLILLLQRMNVRKQSPPKLTTKTVVKCTKCNYTETREFKKGDFILKIEGTCPKCNSPMYIEAIYAEPTQTQK